MRDKALSPNFALTLPSLSLHYSQSPMFNWSSTAFLASKCCLWEPDSRKVKSLGDTSVKIPTGPIANPLRTWQVNVLPNAALCENLFKHFSRVSEERIAKEDLEINNNHRAINQQAENLFGTHCSLTLFGRIDLRKPYPIKWIWLPHTFYNSIY